jgi:hypothetical protein
MTMLSLASLAALAAEYERFKMMVTSSTEMGEPQLGQEQAQHVVGVPEMGRRPWRP